MANPFDFYTLRRDGRVVRVSDLTEDEAKEELCAMLDLLRAAGDELDRAKQNLLWWLP